MSQSRQFTKRSKTEKPETQQESRINPIILTIGSAVGAVLLITFLRPFFGPKDASDPSILFSKYSTPSPIVLAGEGAISEVEKKYNQANYKSAAALFDPLIKATPTAYDLYLYDGIAHLHEGELKAALARFDTVLDNDPALKQEAIWYKALTYLQQDDKENGRSLLEKIAQNKTYIYHEKAAKLLLDWQ